MQYIIHVCQNTSSGHLLCTAHTVIILNVVYNSCLLKHLVRSPPSLYSTYCHNYTSLKCLLKTHYTFPATFQGLGKYFILISLLDTLNKSFLWKLLYTVLECFHADGIKRYFMCLYNSILTLCAKCLAFLYA
jgi:hypothetical protein